MASSVVHFEIPVDDVERAGEFYRKVFDWEISSMPGMGYTLLSTTATGEDGRPSEPGAINGGMMRRTGELTAPILTIAVEDIDATLEQLASLGGSTVRGREPVGDMGFAAYFTDSEGNVVGLWENA